MILKTTRTKAICLYSLVSCVAWLCACSETKFVREQPTYAAFDGISFTCLEGDGELAVPITLSSEVITPFTLTIISDDAEARRVLNLPVKVEVPAGATQVVAHLSITDDQEVNDDRLCRLSISAEGNIAFRPETSACTVTVLNDDASIEFLKPEHRISPSFNDCHIIPIVIKGYQPQPVTVKVGMEDIEGLELLDDGIVTIPTETHEGYARVKHSVNLKADDVAGALKLEEVPKQLIVTRNQTKLTNVAVTNLFTGKWNLYISDYEDMSTQKRNVYIPAEITRLTTSDEINDEVMVVKYQCLFEMDNNEILCLYMSIDFIANTLTIHLGSYYLYDKNGVPYAYNIFGSVPMMTDIVLDDVFGGYYTSYFFDTIIKEMIAVYSPSDTSSFQIPYFFRGRFGLVRPTSEDSLLPLEF